MYLEPVENGTLEGVYVAFFEFQGGSGGRCKFVTESATSLRSSQWHAFEELDAESADETLRSLRTFAISASCFPDLA